MPRKLFSVGKGTDVEGEVCGVDLFPDGFGFWTLTVMKAIAPDRVYRQPVKHEKPRVRQKNRRREAGLLS